MAQEIIDLGEGPDSNTGDSLYTAFTKTNSNFTELYTIIGSNSTTNLTGNLITANNFYTTGNLRVGDINGFGNVTTIGNVIAAQFFYPNGVGIGTTDLNNLESNLLPNVGNVYSIGSFSNTWVSAYLSTNLNLQGATITTDGTDLYVNGAPVTGTYSNSNVASYLPIYSGNLDSVNFITANGITVNGNLTVDGNISYFNVDVLTVEDPIITLNTAANGAPLTSNNGFDSGVKSFYYDTENRSSFFGRIDSTGNFEYYNLVSSETGNVIAGTLGNIRGDKLLGDTGVYVANIEVVDGNANIVTSRLQDSGVTADTYGNASAVPQITVDAKGRVTNLTTVAVAGVSDLQYTSANSNLTLSTSAGTEFSVNLGVGTDDIPTFAGLVVNGNILPGSNVAYSLGSSDSRFANLWLSGNTIHLDDSTIESNSTSVIITNPLGGQLVIDGTSVSSSAEIVNGNSNVRVASNGNVTVSVAGNNAVVTVTDSSLRVVGEIVVNNAIVIDSGGEIVTSQLKDSGVAADTYGNATLIPVITVDSKGRITNATTTQVAGVSNVTYDTDTSNLTVSTYAGDSFVVDLGVGTQDSPEFTNLTLSGNLLSATGANVGELSVNGTVVVDSGSEIVTAQLKDSGVAAGTYGNATLVPIITVDAKGRITEANTTQVAGVSNLTYDSATGNLSVSTHAGDTFSVDINVGTEDSPQFSGLTLTGTLTGTTLEASQIGNSGATLTGTLDTAAQPNITSLGTLTGLTLSGNLDGTNLNAASVGNTGTLLTGTLTTASQPNVTSLSDSVTIGEITVGSNAITSTHHTITIEPAEAGSTGNVIIEGNLRVAGNVTYIDSETITTNDKDILIANNTSNIADLNGAGILIGNIGGVGIVTWTYSTTLDAFIPNVGIVPQGNASLNLGGTSNYWNNLYTANVFADSLTGTLQTAAQPNVTSLGTLTGLILSGTLTGTTVEASEIGNSGATLTGTLSTASQPNVTSLGTLTALAVSGTLTGNVIEAAQIGNVGATITAATVSAATIGNTGTTLTGTLSTASQPNVTSLGTLTGLTLSGTLTGTTVEASQIGNAGSTLTGASVSAATVGNAGANIVGATLDTSANATVNGLSVNTSATFGTTVDVTGNITFANAETSGNITASYFLGNGRFLDGIDTTLISNGTSNVKVYEDSVVTVSVNSNDNVAVFSDSSLTVNNTIYTATVNAATIGNAGAALIGQTLNTSANATVNGLTVNTSATISTTLDVTGNVTAGNLSATNLAGTLETAAQPNVTSLGTLTGLTLSGTLTGTTVEASQIGNTGATLTGTLSTAAQPNVTSLGTLTGLTLTGTLTGTTLNAAQIGNAGAVITGASVSAATIGNTGAVLQGATVNTTANATVNGLTVNNSATVGTTLGVAGITTITNTTDSNDTVTGALIVAGGVGIAKKLSVGANAVISGSATIVGDLNVSGNVNYSGSNNLVISDNVIELHVANVANVAEPWTFDDGKDIGLRFHYYQDADKSAAFVFSHDERNFEFYDDGALGANTFSGNSYGGIKAGTATLVNTTPTTGNATGALQVYGGTSVSGNLYVVGQFTVENTVTFENTVSGTTIEASTIGNSGATLTGTISTASQPNITSLGTLTGLTLSGTLTGTTLEAAQIGNAGATITGATVSAATIGNSGTTLTGTLSTASQPNVTSLGTLTGLTLSGTLTGTTLEAAQIGNSGATLTGTLNTASQPNITSLGTLTGLTLSGTLTGTTVEAATIGNSGTTLTGTLSTASQPNVTSLGTLTGLTLSGTLTGTTVEASQIGNVGTTFTGASVSAATIGNSGATLTGTLSTASQPNVTSLGTLTGLTLSGTLTGTTVEAAQIGNTGATLTGTLNTASQPNITSLGTLTGLTLTGTLTGTTVEASQIGNVGTTFTGAGVSAATIGNSGATLTGTLSTASQPNVTSLGTLTGLTLSGTLTGTTINAAAIGNTGATLTGTLQTAAQPNVTSLGTLTALTVSGTLISQSINAAIIGNAGAALVGSTVSAGIIGNAGATIVGTSVSAATIGNSGATLTGTLSTASQPNVTSLGILTGLTLSGTLTGTILEAATIGNSGTTLTGTLSTASQPNVTSLGTLTGLTLSGTLTGTTINAATIGNAGAIITAANVNAAILGNAGTVITGATVSAATIGNSGTTLTGTLSTAAQPNVTSLGTLTGLTLSGTLTGTTVEAAQIGNTGTTLTGTIDTAAQPNINELADSVTIGEITIGSNAITSTHHTITIEPADAGSTGNVVIEGNLRVTGNVTYIDSETIVTNDKDIMVANNTSNIADLNGAGILVGNIGGVGIVTWTYGTVEDAWISNVGIAPAANATLDFGGTSNYWDNAYIASLISTSVTGTLATAAQPNVTSLGTLTGLTLSGTLTGTTIEAATIGNTGTTLTGTLSTAAQPNVTSLGTLTGLTLSGTLTGTTVEAAQIGNTGTTLTGTISTAAQTNITSLGTLTGLTLSGTLNGTTVQAATIGNTGAAIIGNTGTFAGDITANGNIILNNRQVIQLYDDDSSNWVGFRANATVAADILWTLPGNDGTPNQILSTDGAKNLFWAAPGGGDSGFVNSTITTAPGSSADYDLAKPTDQTQPPETPFEAGGSDPFGVSLGIIYDNMEPIGRYVTVDYGDGEPYVGG